MKCLMWGTKFKNQAQWYVINAYVPNAVRVDDNAICQYKPLHGSTHHVYRLGLTYRSKKYRISSFIIYLEWNCHDALTLSMNTVISTVSYY